MPERPAHTRISAAIEKLARLRDDAPDGPWSSVGTGRAHGDHWHVIADDESIAYIAAQDGINEAERQPTADLIATLHRTIPYLLSSLAQAKHDVEHGYGVDRRALALCDVILEEQP